MNVAHHPLFNRDAAKFRRWSEVNAAKQVAEKARRATEAQLLQAWPHGLPVRWLMDTIEMRLIILNCHSQALLYYPNF